jgi:hypothetical protein
VAQAVCDPSVILVPSVARDPEPAARVAARIDDQVRDAEPPRPRPPHLARVAQRERLHHLAAVAAQQLDRGRGIADAGDADGTARQLPALDRGGRGGQRTLAGPLRLSTLAGGHGILAHAPTLLPRRGQPAIIYEVRR